jgi:hypothetical protein
MLLEEKGFGFIPFPKLTSTALIPFSESIKNARQSKKIVARVKS